MSSEDLTPDADSTFDDFATNYDASLKRGLRFTGESKEYFSDNRILLLAKHLEKLKSSPKRILDFGCGTGGSIPFFQKNFDLAEISGIDPSEKSLQIARKTHGTQRGAKFLNTETFNPSPQFDLAYCNGVFHHIPTPEQLPSAKLVFESLNPGAYFSFWENNPWNPMTRFIMKRVPFDHDAILIWPRSARRLLRLAGFNIIATSFAFVFPSALKYLRFLERPLCKLPLGGQYQVLCRKPLHIDA
ncbi:MAG: class I SAM-dependent methyltransferase [Verrucomicrobiaceae bacterium]|nr:class I SAM-dependent methyltransferase [Verrucomicrobiaceae bacterium]